MNDQTPNLIDTSEVGGPIRGMLAGLRDEIESAQSDRSKSFEVREGVLLYGEPGAYFYRFTVDREVRIPPESPVTLVVAGEQPNTGVLVHYEDYQVVVRVRNYVEHTVPRASISVEPWFILAALKRRLEDALDREAEDIIIPLSLLGRVPHVAERAGTRGNDHRSQARSGLTSLNRFQREGIEAASTAPFHLVWGPPGTGKTQTLASFVRCTVENSESCLVLAHANAAVDVAAVRIAGELAGTEALATGRVLRIGSPHLQAAREFPELSPEFHIQKSQPALVARRNELELEREQIVRRLKSLPDAGARETAAERLEELRAELEDVNNQMTSAVAELIESADVVLTTLSRLAISDQLCNLRPSTTVVDEISMASMPFVMLAALVARDRLVGFGDFRQLAPIALSSTPVSRAWLHRDAFEVSGAATRMLSGEGDERVTLLRDQYRMASTIANVVSEFAYSGLLRTPPEVDARLAGIRALEPGPGASVVIVDTSNSGSWAIKDSDQASFSRVNPLHAVIAIGLARKIASTSGCNLAYITPYRAQASLIEVLRRDLQLESRLEASTVHRFQGGEADVVVLDLVDGPPFEGPSRLTAKDPEAALRLLNVAASRARGKLIVIANLNFARARYPKDAGAFRLLRLIEECDGQVVDAVEVIKSQRTTELLRWYPDWTALDQEVADEVRQAQRPMRFNLRDGFEPRPALRSALIDRGAACTVFAPAKVAEEVPEEVEDLRLLVRPGGYFAMFPHGVAYIGGLSPAQPIARLRISESVEKLEYQLFGTSLVAAAPVGRDEPRIASVLGRCGVCGEDLAAAWVDNLGVVAACESPLHPPRQLQGSEIQELVEAMGQVCDACGGPPAIQRDGPRAEVICKDGCSGAESAMPDLMAFLRS